MWILTKGECVMRCPRCNKPIRDDDLRCRNCGRDLTDLDEKEYYGRETRGGQNSAMTMVLWILGGLILLGLLGLLYYKMSTANAGKNTEQTTAELMTEAETLSSADLQTEATAIPEPVTAEDPRPVTGKKSTEAQTEAPKKVSDLKLVDRKDYYVGELPQKHYDIEVAKAICDKLDYIQTYGTPEEKKLLMSHPGRVYSLDEEMKNEMMRGWILEALETDELPTPAYTDDRACRYSFCFDQNDFIQVYAGTPETKDAWMLWPMVAPEYMEAVYWD